MRELNNMVEQYRDETHLWSFEGYSGVENFKKLLGALGYEDNNGDALVEFLADNSGAVEAMYQWIVQCNYANEWKEALAKELGIEEEE